MQNQIQKATRYLQKCQEREVADNAKSNPKTFWQFVNRKTKTTVGIADLEMSGTNELTKDCT